MGTTWFVLYGSFTLLLFANVFFFMKEKDWMTNALHFAVLGASHVVCGMLLVFSYMKDENSIARFVIPLLIAAVVSVMIARLLYTHTRTPKEIRPIAIVGIVATAVAILLMIGGRNEGNQFLIYMVPILIAFMMTAIGFILFYKREEASNINEETDSSDAVASKK
jgi:FtsH-binding integral membrane protein